MGRPMQKKKNRSSLNKVRQKPKSKKVNPRSNPIVAANWDKKQTLVQNYRRLGLLSRLNAPTGGTEKFPSTLSDPHNPPTTAHLPFAVSSKPPTSSSEVRVERDPETGAIRRVLRPEHSNPLNDPLNDIVSSSDDEIAQSKEGEPRNGIVRELESQAAMEVRPRPREQSSREREWIASLVEKYGEDYAAMVRDRKLNPYQQTEGDIRRRAGKWKEREERKKQQQQHLARQEDETQPS